MTVFELSAPSSELSGKSDLRFFAALLTGITGIAVFVWWKLGWEYQSGGMSWYPFAKALLEEKKFTSDLSPLFTLYFAFWMLWFGKTFLATKIALLFSYWIAAIGIYRVSWILFADRNAARFTSIMTAISPFYYWETLTAGYELPSAAFITGYILMALYVYQNNSIRSVIGFGFYTGVGALIKSALSPVIIVTLFYLALIGWIRRRFWKQIYYLLLAGMAFALPVSAWMTRNWVQAGYFALADPVHAASTLYQGHNPWSQKGIPLFGNDATPEFQAELQRIESSSPTGDRAVIAQEHLKAVKASILADPFNRLVIVGCKKIWCGFKFYDREEILYWGPLLPLAFWGLWTLGQKGAHTWVVHALLGLYLFITYIFFGFSRYRVAYLPVILLLDTSAIFWFYHRWERKTFYYALALYFMPFIISYGFAKTFRAIWLNYIPQLRM